MEASYQKQRTTSFAFIMVRGMCTASPPTSLSVSCRSASNPSTRPTSNRSELLATTTSPDALGLYGYTLPQSQSTLALLPSSPLTLETWTPATPTTAAMQVAERSAEIWPEFQPYGTLNPRSSLMWTPLCATAVTEAADVVQPVLVMPSDRSSTSSSVESSDIYSFRSFTQALAPGAELEQHAGLLNQTEHGPYLTLEEHQSLTMSPQRLQSFAGLPNVQTFRFSLSPQTEIPASSSADAFQRGRGFRSMSAPQKSPVELSDSEQTITEIDRTRKRRRLTTAENANYQCDLCGKLFQRNYNLKTHMDIHNPRRDKPNLCEHVGCDKKFVRRTDLQRHEQTVSSLSSSTN